MGSCFSTAEDQDICDPVDAPGHHSFINTSFRNLSSSLFFQLDEILDEIISNVSIKIQQKLQPKSPQKIVEVDSIRSLFKIKEQIGVGATSKVFRAIKRSNGQTYVLKQIAKQQKKTQQKLFSELFHREVDILSSINQKNIIEFRGAYSDKKNWYICYDLCSGGTLYDRILEAQRLTEYESRKVLKTILETISYMHSHNIIHRDIKAENIMYIEKSIHSEPILIDFGLALRLKNEQTFETFVGTIPYLAPEVLQGRNVEQMKKTDMWAIGVVAFALLTGCFPFKLNVTQDLRSLHKRHIHWPRSSFVSESAKHFVESLLEVNTTNRLSAKEALKHPWILNE